MNFSQFHTEPFILKVSKGKVNGHSTEHKFGAVPAMSQNQTGSIWDVNDTIYPWSAFSSASIINVATVNSSDDGKTITVVGLDANYNEQTENIVVSDSSSVNSIKTFIRVYRAFMHDTSAVNVADINIRVSTTVVARITAGQGQTLMAVYTVPTGYTAYIIKKTCTCQANADATVGIYIRPFGENAFRVKHSFEVSGEGGQYLYDSIPTKVTEKSDIDFIATVRTNNARLTAAFDILLVNNLFIGQER